MDKQEKFINWLCGKGEFPFFKDMPKVAYPIGYFKDQEIKSCDNKYENLSPEDDIFNKEGEE